MNYSLLIVFITSISLLGCGSDSKSEPTSEAPSTETPSTGTPSTETPGTGTPGTETPGTETPGTETPGTETPGTETPGTETPGTGTPGTGTPGTETPGTETPGTETPGTGTPGTETPGTGTPGTETPGTETPGTETPGTGTPGTGTPGTGTTGTETPGTETPGTETPGTETPGTGTPGTGTPGTGTPGTETPGTETPGTETPGTATPGTETPGTETPGTETPGTETPGTETPVTNIAILGQWQSLNDVGIVVEFTETQYLTYLLDAFNQCYVEKAYPVSYNTGSYIVDLPLDNRGENASQYPYTNNYQLADGIITILSDDLVSISERLEKQSKVELNNCHDENRVGMIKVAVSFSNLDPLLQKVKLDKQASFRFSIAFDVNNNAQIDDADIAIHLISTQDTGELAFLTPIMEDASNVPTFIDTELDGNTLSLLLPKSIHPSLDNINNTTALSAYAFYGLIDSSGNDVFPNDSLFTDEASSQILDDNLNDVNGVYNAGVDITQLQVIIIE